ncbi:MAG: TatD family hydrolase [Bacillota bacterium]|nr:TatD family hydrolase [Bacillota bacterium]
MLFDSHAHYDDEKFNEDRDDTIKNARESGVSYILNAATDIDTSLFGVGLTEKYDFIYTAVGVHPHCVGAMDEDAIIKMSELVKKPKVVAVGEIGLDYYYDNSPRDVQKHWFLRQIEFAKDVNKPIIVHDRDAHEDIMNLIKSSHAEKVGGVIHCFSGSVQMAKELLDLGFYLSFAGAVTFKNARKAIEVLQYAPIDRILIETDSPYLTPEPFRGKRNDSRHVRLVAEKIAEIKGLSFEDVALTTLNNAKDLFGIA